jgi:hypothetical protein
MSSTPRDLEGIRCLITIKISESETGGKDINSEDDERIGKTTGQEDYFILF